MRDLYRKVRDIGGLHFHQVPSKSVPRGAKTSQKTVYLRIPSEQTTCCFLQARTEPSRDLPTSKVYVEFHAESDFEGPRAVRGHSMAIFVIFLILGGNGVTSKSAKFL